MLQRRLESGMATISVYSSQAKPMTHAPTQTARRLAHHWLDRRHLESLPAHGRPSSRAEGYAVQALWPAIAGRVGGWKIAATSVAGQRHIGVSGPLAGPVFEQRLHANGATISLVANRMRVAECEVVFTFKRALDPRPQPWSRDEVIAQVAQVLPGIEVPDSRFLEFERAGEAQLLADCACCNDMVLGAAMTPDARLNTLASLAVVANMRDGRRLEGIGSDALGDPVEALRWFVNEMSAVGQRIEAHHFVTTGTCITPIPVEPGHAIHADFGWLGRMTVRFV
jgi:2-keto-4-pentenoate hydratase